MPGEKLLTWVDVSALLSVGIPTLRKWVFERRIPALRLAGGRRALVRFRASEIEKWIDQQRVGGVK